MASCRHEAVAAQAGHRLTAQDDGASGAIDQAGYGIRKRPAAATGKDIGRAGERGAVDSALEEQCARDNAFLAHAGSGIVVAQRKFIAVSGETHR